MQAIERTHLGKRLLALLDDGKSRRSVGKRAVAAASALALTLAAGLAALQPARAAAVKAVRAAVSPLLSDTVPKPVAKAAAAPVPKNELALAGTVKGPSGKPVEGALVIVKPSGTWVQPVTTTTAADGRFRLPLPPRMAGPWDVVIEARGLARTSLERVTPGVPLTLNLLKGGVITGTVRDGVDGRPVIGARVVAIAPTSLRHALPWQASVGSVEAITDRDGRFRLEGVARGLFEVSARAARYASAPRRNVRAGASVDLLVFPGASIAGVVRGVGDRPIPGAIVAAQRRDTHGWMGAGVETTDRRGAFVLAGVEPGSYVLMARHPDLAPALIAVEVAPLAEARADVALQPGAPVLGQLVDEQGRAIAGKLVFETLGGQAVPRPLADSLKVETGADGIFALAQVPVGAHDLGLTASGFAARRLEVEVRPRDKSLDVGKVVLERGLTIAGRVVDRAGTPLANASLYAWPMTSATFAFNSSSPEPVLSAADGSFVIGGLETGAYNVIASIPGYVTEGKKTEAGAEEPLRLVLAPAGSLTGSVVDSRRGPVESFTVMAERAEKDDNRYGASGYKEVTAPDGRFTIDGLAEGTYVVRARAPDTAPGSVSGVKVVAGKATEAGVIRLGTGGVVRGLVVDTSGAPVAGATLSATIPGPLAGRDRAEAQSDSNGAFEIGGVPAGSVTVAATHPNYAAGQVAGLEVDPAKGPTETRIVVSVGGRIQGSVRKRDGTPMPGLRLTGSPKRSDDEVHYLSGVSATVQNDGTFSMEHVAPGPVSVTLMAQPSSGVSLTAERKSVMVVEGQTTTVDFIAHELLITGRVTRGDAAVPGVRVTVRTLPFTMSVGGGLSSGVAAPPTGPRPLEGITREDGQYELIVLHPGPAWAEVASLDGRVQYATRNLEVPDVERHVFDIQIGGAPVGGMVVDKETGAGVPLANVRAMAKKGEANGGANTGLDGRFAFELAPGDYRLTTSAEAYATVESELSVGAGGSSDVRLELSRGMALEGKVVDLAGRPVPGAQLFPKAGDSTAWLGMAVSMDDGRFRIERLMPRPYTLATGSSNVGFAIRGGVSPGDKDVVLTLRPGGRIRLTAVDPSGAPVAQVGGSLASVDGLTAFLFLNASTDAQGVAEFGCPAGLVELNVSNGKLTGKATVQVEVGATASARVVLAPLQRGE